jgi:hypothetical protein
MLEELQRNFANSTIRYYISTGRDFAGHKPPDQMGVEELRVPDCTCSKIRSWRPELSKIA